ncbi:MAG: hypothetical protein GY771_00370, partial [bacterium]|nr:hypothetical protein [bacterium]
GFFASRISDLLTGRQASDNIAIALYGEPGSGKTSLLNLIEYYLREKIGKSKKEAVVRFNPWLAGDTAGIYRDYFAQITAVFESATAKTAKQLAVDIGEYTTALYRFSADASGGTELDGDDDLRSNADLLEMKKELARKIASSDYRIYALVDDIDKLKEENLLAFLRLVTAHADLPGILNLLTFHDQSVARVIGGDDLATGWKEIDKIVQVGFDVPRINEQRVSDIFFDALFGILEPCHLSETGKTEIINLYRSAMREKLSNMRNIKRFLNSLIFHLPIVAGEVNIPDFIALDFIRLFYPDIYFDIYKQRDYLIGSSDDAFFDSPTGNVNDRIKALWKGSNENDADTTKTICARLFPRVSFVFEGEQYGSKLEISWIKDKRICSEHYFDKYFTFVAPAGKLSDKEFDRIIKKVLEKKDTEPLLPLIENGKINDYFNRLIWASDEFDDGDITVLATTMFEVGDKAKIDARDAIGMPNTYTADYVCWWLLKRLPKPEQLRIVKEVLEDGTSLQTVLKYVRDRVITTYMGTPEFNPSEINEIKEAAKARIAAALDADELLSNPEIIPILFTWRDLEGSEAPSEYINSCFQKTDEAVELINRFAIISKKADPTNKYLTKMDLTYDFRALDVFVGVEDIANRLIESAADIEDEDKIKVIEDFIRMYNDYAEAQKIQPPQPEELPAPPESKASAPSPQEPPPIPKDKLES